MRESLRPRSSSTGAVLPCCWRLAAVAFGLPHEQRARGTRGRRADDVCPVCCGSAGLSLWPGLFQHNPSARRFGPALPACRPCGWNNNNWSATPSPSGHANVNLNNGNVNDNSDSNNNNNAAYQVL